MQYHTVISIDETVYIVVINFFLRSDLVVNQEQLLLESEVGVTLNNTVLYNAMIHPFTRMVIRGVIWYQGIP